MREQDIIHSGDCPGLAAPPEHDVIDPEGDLHLVVGRNGCIVPDAVWWHMPPHDPESEFNKLPHEHERAISYTVCSKALSRASPVWKALLYGNFAESRPKDGSQWVVHLPDDSPESMMIVLSIIHGSFERIPEMKDFYLDEVYSLTQLTHKYDLSRLLRPWSLDWMHRVWDLFDPEWSISLRKLGQCLWVSWELGDEAAFQVIVQFIADITEISDEDEKELHLRRWPRWSNYSDFMVFEEWMGPPGAFDCIREYRVQCIDRILDPLRLELQDTTNFEGVFMCDRTGEAHGCGALLLGLVIQNLHWIDLWPIPETANCRMSPRALRYEITKIRIPRNVLTRKHEKCGKNGLKRLCDKIPDTFDLPTLTPFQKLHFEKQSQKTGISYGRKTSAERPQRDEFVRPSSSW